MEKKGVQAILAHVEKGRGTLTASVPEGRVEEFKELLEKRHVPYVEIAYTNPETKEKSMFFVYRDSDREKMAQIIKAFALEVDQSCHEVDMASFEEMILVPIGPCGICVRKGITPGGQTIICSVYGRC